MNACSDFKTVLFPYPQLTCLISDHTPPVRTVSVFAEALLQQVLFEFTTRALTVDECYKTGFFFL